MNGKACELFFVVVLKVRPKRTPIDPSSVGYHLGFTCCYKYLHRDYYFYRFVLES